MFRRLYISTCFASSVVALFVASNANADDPAYQQQACPDTYYAAREASCKQAAQQIYAADSSDCKYYAAGGGAVGAAGLGYAGWALASGGPFGLTALAVGAVGTGAGIFGSSSCYNDATVMRDLNVASCEYSTAQLKLACYDRNRQQPRGTSSQSAGGGGDTGSSGGNNSGAGNNSGGGYQSSPIVPKGRVGRIDIF